MFASSINCCNWAWPGAFTVTVTVACTWSFAFAMIFTVPLATAVIFPVASTFAIDSSSLDQVTTSVVSVGERVAFTCAVSLTFNVNSVLSNVILVAGIASLCNVPNNLISAAEA